ncbi:MAG: 4-hydroxy-tetrahydrodipicolinate synthase [Proteobacteria bacterium]|nr:4-hydroxy-tetrahydrodipicolinate synthase [Pseudomonadota bacterium]
MHKNATHGIHTALVTPFDADGTLRLDLYAALCERQIQAGIHGLVPCGTTGEAATVTAEEWSQIVETAVTVSAGRVAVCAGVGTNNTASTLVNIRAAKELGVDTGLLVFPYYNKPNPAGLRAHVRACLAEGLPLVLYHVPGRTGQRLSPELLAELASYEGVVAVKEATGDLRFVGDVLHRTNTAILSGDDFTFLGLLAQGGAGCISVISNVAPAETVAVYEHFAAGRINEATTAFRKLWPLASFLFSDSNPVPAKAALAELGLSGPAPRLPLAPYEGPSPRPLLENLGLL